MSFIPDHIVEQVRTQTNILDVVGVSVRLRKAGRNYLGLCPFHKEKTPSFNVSVERGSYKCFGCGKGGDAFSFVQESMNVNFVDAVRILAEKAGIPIPENVEEDDGGMSARRDSARKALEAAAQYFHHVLTSNPNHTAAKFFSKRGFSDESIEKFFLGAAEQKWDGLMQHLTKNGFTREHMLDAGLIVVNDNGKVYDRFRGRAMFALSDHLGRVVGFSARQLDPADKMAKFVNSPQTIVFDKSKTLFGLFLAKKSISQTRTALIVEGQADVVSMHQGGFDNTVASSGTSLTLEHLQILRKYAEKVVLIFDADSAGQKAMSRSIELCLQLGFGVSCVTLPEGTDPDSIVRDDGPDTMKGYLDNAVSWIHFQREFVRSQGGLEDSATKAQTLKTMIQWISSVPEQLQHPFLLRELSEAFDVDEQFIQSAMRSIQSVPRNASTRQLPSVGITETQHPSRPPLPADVALILPSERELLSVALTATDGLAMLLHEFNIDVQTFYTQTARDIYNHILIAEHEHHDIVSAILEDQTISTVCRKLVGEIAASVGATSDEWRKFSVDIPAMNFRRTVQDALYSLRLYRIGARVAELSRRVELELDDNSRQRLLMAIGKCISLRETMKQKFANNPEDMSWQDADIA